MHNQYIGLTSAIKRSKEGIVSEDNVDLDKQRAQALEKLTGPCNFLGGNLVLFGSKAAQERANYLVSAEYNYAKVQDLLSIDSDILQSTEKHKLYSQLGSSYWALARRSQESVDNRCEYSILASKHFLKAKKRGLAEVSFKVTALFLRDNHREEIEVDYYQKVSDRLADLSSGTYHPLGFRKKSCLERVLKKKGINN